MCPFAKGSEYCSKTLAPIVTLINFCFTISFLSHNFIFMHLFMSNHFMWENKPLFLLQPFLENTSMNIMAATSLLGGENGLD